MFIVVAHRNMLSVFDMNNTRKEWVEHVTVFDEAIRSVAVKKRELVHTSRKTSVRQARTGTEAREEQ